MRNNILSIIRGLRLFIAIAVIIGMNIIGFGIITIGVKQELEEIVTVLVLYATASVLIGSLVTKAWYLSLLTYLIPFFIGLSMIVSLSTSDKSLILPLVFKLLVFIPIISILFGYLGHLLKQLLIKLLPHNQG